MSDEKPAGQPERLVHPELGEITDRDAEVVRKVYAEISGLTAQAISLGAQFSAEESVEFRDGFGTCAKLIGFDITWQSERAQDVAEDASRQ